MLRRMLRSTDRWRHARHAVVLRKTIACLATLTAVTACDNKRSRNCHALLQARDFQAAATVCTLEYETTGTVAHGIAAARAHAASGNDTEVLAWAERIGDQPAAAALWRVVAGAHQRTGSHEALVRARKRARDLWIAQDQYGEASYEAHRLSKAYRRRSQLLEALAAAQDSLHLARQSDDSEMKLFSLTSVLTSLDEIGDVEAARGLIEGAGTFLDTEDPRVAFYLLFYTGQTFYAQRRFALARSWYRKALAYQDAAQGTHTIRAARFNIVDSCLEDGCLDIASQQLATLDDMIDEQSGGNPAIALWYYQARLALARSAPNQTLALARKALAHQPIDDWRWQLHDVAGQALAASGHTIAAMNEYRHAITVVEKLRRSLVFDDLKALALERKRAPFERLFALHAKSGQLEQAVAVSERARARAFLDAFIASTTESSTPTQRSIAVTRDQHKSLSALLPGLSSSPVVSPHPVARLLATTGDATTLAYFEAAQQMWLLVLDGEQPTLQALPASPADLAAAVTNLDADRDNSDGLTAVAALLLPPQVQRRLRRGGPLRIVSDGAIARVSFAALRVGGRYLVQDHHISYIPSLSAGVELSRARTLAATEPIIIGASTGTSQLPALPGAQTEAHAVAARLNRKPFVGALATTSALARAQHASLLHIAGHSGFSPRGAWLQLADGRIHAGEIVAMSLRPRTVVLASCRSAARRGRGLWGALGASFLAAGSGPVIASLWPVADKQMASTMDAFYAAGGKDRPIAALAQIQRARLDRGLPPSQWAGLVALGIPAERKSIAQLHATPSK